MKVFILSMCLALLQLQIVYMLAVDTDGNITSFHFDFKTENGQQREEDVKYDDSRTVASSSLDKSKLQDEVTMKPLEFRGGYSFISADGYEYTVKYKANKNGFQPYVTARKLKNSAANS